MLYNDHIISIRRLNMSAKKEYKLDLFKQVLPALDKRDFSFYKNLSIEEKKGFADIVALRYMSTTADSNKELCEYHILAANEANKNLWHSELRNHKELQYLVLALIGTGRVMRHEWIKGPVGKKRNNKVFDLVKKYYSTASNDEIQMFIDMNTADDLIELAKEFGTQDEELKELKKEIKKVKK